MKPYLRRLLFAAACCITSLSWSASVPDTPRAAAPTDHFRRFYGEWTLKDDRWNQNWGQGDEQVTIPHHHTLSKPLNTPNSVLSVVDATHPRGHILWSYNRTTREVHHLSSFGNTRNGVGTGTLNERGDLRLKVNFEDEAAGTYRIYTYTWVSEDEYELLSTQFDARDQPTGLYYGGTFVRLPSGGARAKDLAAIRAILRTIDDNDADLATKLSVYADDVVHMAPDNAFITNKADLSRHLEASKQHGRADMTHHILQAASYDDIVLMRGEVTGTYHPRDGSSPSPIQTKNLFVFRRYPDDSLKIWQVIFNFAPVR